MFKFQQLRDLNRSLIVAMPMPMPSKKEFQVIRELIADAEKYDNKEEIELSNESLQSLIGYVEKYIKSNHPEK